MSKDYNITVFEYRFLGGVNVSVNPLVGMDNDGNSVIRAHGLIIDVDFQYNSPTLFSNIIQRAHSSEQEYSGKVPLTVEADGLTIQGEYKLASFGVDEDKKWKLRFRQDFY